jgi:NADH pyrophosphatase NudC (nudix superfamily)
MKKIAYTETQIIDIVNGLGLLSIKGIQQARILTTIAGLLDQGEEIESSVGEEGNVNNDAGKTD